MIRIADIIEWNSWGIGRIDDELEDKINQHYVLVEFGQYPDNEEDTEFSGEMAYLLKKVGDPDNSIALISVDCSDGDVEGISETVTDNAGFKEFIETCREIVLDDLRGKILTFVDRKGRKRFQ